ncbi:MAG TPA: nuclear transport factor 2 family protein [Chitinophagaceae bacterium]
MKQFFLLLLFSVAFKLSIAQDQKQKVERACLDYIEGFYEGDSTKLIRSLKPSLYKFGYWKNKTSGVYEPNGRMTYRQALDYANNVLAKKNFAKADAPKKVEILDIGNIIASAKVSAWWGIDYILLVKQDDKWMIEQVLWEGPPAK